MNIFEQGTKRHLRFPTTLGVLTIEDLWELPLLGGKLCLDDIAINLDTLVTHDRTKSFVTENKAADPDITLSFEIVKRVIEIKKAASDKARKARETRETKQKIMAIIATKQDEELASKSIEELSALVDGL